MRNARAALASLFFLVASAAITIPPVSAAGLCAADDTKICLKPGFVDPTFGDDGATWSKLGTNHSLGAQAMAVQADGKIVLAGSASDDGANHDFAVARYLSDGSPDATFGSNGAVRTTFGAVVARGEAVAVQDDGKIIVAGAINYGDSTAVLVRYNTDGTLDPGFGAGGIVLSPATWHSYHAIALLADGRILVVGSRSTNFLLARYLSDGTLDASFGDGGTVLTDVGGYHGFGARALALQADGKILAGGAAQNGTYLGCVLARYDSAGDLDASFGSGGIVKIPQQDGEVCYLEALAVQSDGKILASGNHTSIGPGSARYFRLMRFNDDGSLDPTLRKRGIADTIVIRSLLRNVTITSRSLALQPDGYILEGGVVGGGEMVIVRHRPDGRKDRRFTSYVGLYRGVSLVPGDFPQWIGALDGAQALAVLPSGRILVAGNVGGEFGLARLVTSVCAYTPGTGELDCP
jgi:uncharacterized delta-60 repeat protein